MIQSRCHWWKRKVGTCITNTIISTSIFLIYLFYFPLRQLFASWIGWLDWLLVNPLAGKSCIKCNGSQYSATKMSFSWHICVHHIQSVITERKSGFIFSAEATQSLVGRLSGCHQNESKNQTAFMSSWFQLTGQRTLKGPASILLSVSTLIDSQVTSVTGQRCRLSISHKGSCVLRQSAEISTGSLLKSDLYKSLLLLVLSFILTYQVHERERFRGLKGEEQN